MLRWNGGIWKRPTVRILDSLGCLSRVTKSKEKCQPLRMSLLFRCCRPRGWRFLNLAADAVHVCVSIWIEPRGGEGVPMGGGAESSVRGEDSDSNEQCLSAPRTIPTYSQAGSLQRRVGRPSWPSVPHGKYLTLTVVAHVCHITCRFRQNTHCMYDVCWIYVLARRKDFTLSWCINCHFCTHYQLFFWHLHYPEDLHPTTHTKPGCWTPFSQRRPPVFVIFASRTGRVSILLRKAISLSSVPHCSAALLEPGLWQETTGSGWRLPENVGCPV